MSDTPKAAVLTTGLLIPSAGSRTLPASYMQHLAACHELFLSLREDLPESMRHVHDELARVLRRAVSEHPRLALHCYASPAIATPLLCRHLRHSLPQHAAAIDAALAKTVPNLLLELGIRGLLPEGTLFEISASDLTLSSPSLGARMTPPIGTTSLSFESRLVVARANDLPKGAMQLDRNGTADGFDVEPAYLRLGGGVTRFALFDHNPISNFEAHPDKHGNQVDLGGRTTHEWVEALNAALAIIEIHAPDIFAEMRYLLHEIVPVGYHAERHLSASYREAIGTIYLTLHPNTMTLAEAIVHEFQHNKINLASYRTDFLLNPFHPKFPSPVRPDPRPLWGILLAAHAFLPVAWLYRRMRLASEATTAAPDFTRRLTEIDLKNHEAISMLRAHARWTPAGIALMHDLESLDGIHMSERSSQGLSLAPDDVHLA